MAMKKQKKSLNPAERAELRKKKAESKLRRRFAKSATELPSSEARVSFHHFMEAGISIACIPIDDKRVAVGMALKHREDGSSFNRPLVRVMTEGRARVLRRGSFSVIAGIDFVKENIKQAREYEDAKQYKLARKVIAGIIGLSGSNI